MKRMLLTVASVAAATAVFAAPAPAQDEIAINEPNVTLVACPNGLTECVRDLANWTIDRVNDVGPIVGDVCEIVFPSCSLPTP